MVRYKRRALLRCMHMRRSSAPAAHAQSSVKKAPML